MVVLSYVAKPLEGQLKHFLDVLCLKSPFLIAASQLGEDLLEEDFLIVLVTG